MLLITCNPDFFLRQSINLTLQGCGQLGRGTISNLFLKTGQSPLTPMLHKLSYKLQQFDKYDGELLPQSSYKCNANICKELQ